MKPRGLTLIEVVVGTALVAVLVISFAVSLMASVFAQRIRLRNMAAALADQQLAVLRTYDPSSLTNQTNGPLLGVLFTQGLFATVADNTAPSSGNALGAATATTAGLGGVMPLPKNAYADFTLTAKIKANPGAPASWRAGFLFRARDLQNHYEAYLTATSLVLKKVVNGVSTTLYSDVRSISTGSWQTLAVTATGSSLSVSLNGVTATTQTDSSLSVGQAALAVWEGASVNFDDVSIAGDSWNFDQVLLGELHDDWLRFGLGDLPNGTGTLSVATPYGDSSFKNLTVTIKWTDRSGTNTRTLSQTTLTGN